MRRLYVNTDPTTVLRALCPEPPVLMPYWPRDPEEIPIGLDWLDNGPALSWFDDEADLVRGLLDAYHPHRLWFCRFSRQHLDELGLPASPRPTA